MAHVSPQSFLCDLFKKSLAQADPRNFSHLFQNIPQAKGDTVVLGAGKAAAAMAVALRRALSRQLRGFAVVPDGYKLDCDGIDILEAAHPLPDSRSAQFADKALSLAQSLTKDDVLIVLISGGGSSLLSKPLPGIAAEEKRYIHQQLLNSGATIAEMNCVRKHLSSIKGGRLAKAAWPAKVMTFAVSDVAFDDPAVIASGPTVCDPTTQDDALAVLANYKITPCKSIMAVLSDSRWETPKEHDSVFTGSYFKTIIRPQNCLQAAADYAQESEIAAYILGDSIEGEARHVAKVMAAMALQVKNHNQPFTPPCVLLSGGETTVTLGDAGGAGGRNSEFALALAIALDGIHGIYALSADTDGIDGQGDHAGALVTPQSLYLAKAQGIHPLQMLMRHESYDFFDAIDGLIKTGPTFTNVNDFRAIYIEK